MPDGDLQDKILVGLLQDQFAKRFTRFGRWDFNPCVSLVIVEKGVS